MWPSVLDMTRDECRGILRRLELEAYSSVVSTFRAQGGLSDGKIKLLEELRNVFHISTDRHRAEARRVANDEKLCTIAETISGPNTTQEWSREGRRPFPLLPRAAPYTAFSAVANGVAEVVKNENSKLPYPSETTRVMIPDSPQAVQENTKPVVEEDPILLSAEEKRNLKRAHQLSETVQAPSSPTIKKRTISGGEAQSPQNLPMHTNMKIQQLYHNHSKTQSRHKKGIAKRHSGTMKSPKSGISSPNKPPVSVSKPVKPIDLPPASVSKNNLPLPRNMHSYASISQPIVPYDTYNTPEKQAKVIAESQEIASNNWPQIATSKKDITNNLSKLNMMAANSQLHSGNINIVDGSKVDSPVTPQLYTPDGRASANNPITPNQVVWSTKPTTVSAVSQRIALKPSPSVASIKPSNKPPLQPSPTSAISLGSGYININPKPVKGETASVVTINERKELEVANPNLMTVTTFARQDSATTPIADSPAGSHIRASTAIIGTGNFDLKTNTEGSSTTAVTTPSSSGIKPKIQIHSNQTINPAYGSIKLPAGMALKGVTGRKAVQLVSSPGGKVFIQSADGTLKSQPQKGVVTLSPNSFANVAANRYALQKLQIVSSGTPIKPISISKSDVILMPGNVLSTNTGNVVVRSMPVGKQNNRLPSQLVSKPVTTELSGSGVLKNQNVIVIGAVPTEKTIKTTMGNKLPSEASMITEDTPVDILPTPLENSVQLTSGVAVKGTATRYEIKPPITVLQTIASPAIENDAGNRNSSHKQLVTEIVTTAAMESMESDSSFVMSSTDWEVELDQQVSKSRSSSSKTSLKTSQQSRTDESIVVSDEELNDDLESSQQLIDNFHDVIEEDTVDDDSIVNDTIEGEDDVEFDVTYASSQDELDDSVAIEYIDASTASEMVIEEYTETGKDSGDDSDKIQSARIITVPQTSTLLYSAVSTDSSTAKGKSMSVDGQTAQLVYEMDENGLNQVNR